ncbi:MAG: serine hydrolase [Bdellovibrionales bacterium]|nr:serine hydrolase [Bdellovibrionales bacterium]
MNFLYQERNSFRNKNLCIIFFSILLFFNFLNPIFAENKVSYEVDRNRDIHLQCGLEKIISELELFESAKKGDVAISLVDISSISKPKFAGINSMQMVYSASLPKIAILYAALKKAEQGKLEWNDEIQAMAEAMIQHSANQEATELYYIVGPDYINTLLKSDKCALYSASNGGGIWVGKEYGPGEAWEREEVCTLSHAANPIQVARFYYLLETGELLSSPWSRKAKLILSGTGLRHKFIAGLDYCCPGAEFYRKSGSWGSYHSDSALIKYDGYEYILVGLINHPKGDQMLRNLTIETNKLIKTYEDNDAICRPYFE